MKSLHCRSWGLIVSSFIVFFLVACAGEAIKIDLPLNHPANPEADETAFIPPPNPFHGHVLMEMGDSPPSTQKKHIPAHQHQMNDQMGKDSMSAPESGEEKQDHQH